MAVSDKLLNEDFIRYVVVGTVPSKWGHFPMSYLSWEVKKPHNFPFCVFNRLRAPNLQWSIWGCLGEQVTPESGDKQEALNVPRNQCQLFN